MAYFIGKASQSESYWLLVCSNEDSERFGKQYGTNYLL